ncbi:hypothetical protein HFP43_01440 [Streptomyces sp. SJ1-7]|nr:hypothetical protein [Streptomyces sp. SJ1-7]
MPPADACSPDPEAPEAKRAARFAVRTAADARKALADLLTDSPHHTAGVLLDAQLAVTELVSNASRHAGGMTRFDACLDSRGTRLVIDVEDADPRHPWANHWPCAIRLLREDAAGPWSSPWPATPPSTLCRPAANGSG